MSSRNNNYNDQKYNQMSYYGQSNGSGPYMYGGTSQLDSFRVRPNAPFSYDFDKASQTHLPTYQNQNWNPR